MKTNWNIIDWSRSTSEIAAALKCHESEVSRARRKHAPATVSASGKRVSWEGVDWSKRTTEIAAELGVNITTVSNARGRYAPETLRTDRRRKIEASAAVDVSPPQVPPTVSANTRSVILYHTQHPRPGVKYLRLPAGMGYVRGEVFEGGVSEALRSAIPLRGESVSNTHPAS